MDYPQYYVIGYRTLSSKYFNICYCFNPDERLAADKKVTKTNKNNPVHKAIIDAGLDLRVDILYQSSDLTLIKKARNYAHFICAEHILSKQVKLSNYNFVITKKLIEQAIKKGTLISNFKYDAPEVKIDPNFSIDADISPKHATYDLQLKKFKESQFNFAHAKGRIIALTYLSKHVSDLNIDMDFFTDDMGIYTTKEKMEQFIKDEIGNFISSKLVESKKSEDYHRQKLEFWSNEARVSDFINGVKK